MIGSEGGLERPVGERGQWGRETEGAARTVGKIGHKKNETGVGASLEGGESRGGVKPEGMLGHRRIEAGRRAKFGSL